jgi:hypothetical protein
MRSGNFVSEFTRTTLRMFSPVLIWGAHFLAIYATSGIACARGAGYAVVWVVGGASVLAVVAIIAAYRWVAGLESFAAWMTKGLAALAFVAVVWEALTALIIPACV